MKYSEEIKLFNVYYNYDDSMTYQTTTDNFKLWLEQHNEQKLADGNMPDDEEEFEVQEVILILFEKEEVWARHTK